MKRILHVVFILVLALVSGQAGYCQIITTVAGNGNPGYGFEGFPATAAPINYPWNVASDMAGGFYMGPWHSMSGHAEIHRIDYTGTITTYAGTGVSGYSGDGGPASAAQIAGNSIATDAMGNLYICDIANGRIRKVNTSGIICTIAGNGTAGYSGDGGPATAASIGNSPTSPWPGTCIASDPIGNVYVYIWAYNKIRKIDTAGIITCFAGNGTSGSSGDGGPATAASIGYLYGIAADANGNVFISDWSNKRIRKINFAGIISNFAGTGAAGFSGDGGPATAATMQNVGIAIDGNCNVYIADHVNNRVRKIDTSGIINTIAGTGVYGFSGDGGPAVAATLREPDGVGCDMANNIYICDYLSLRVRKISGNDRPVWFTAGAAANISVCQNSLGDSINSTLAIMDSDRYQAEVWSVITSPVHGTMVTSWMSMSTGLVLTPHGCYYKPTAGYSGTDAFQVRVFDGYMYDTLTVNVTVNPLPSSITGATSFSTSGYTTLSSTPNGGTWSSGSSGIATAGGTLGVVTGVSAGSAPISYTLATGCRQITTVNVFPYAGQTIITVAGSGTAGYLSDGVAATSTRINLSYGVVTDLAGNFYIADTWNHRIRKVNSSGVISTIAGTGIAGFGGDGSAATAATINTPTGVALDASGNIYIADQNNQRIRKINTSGIISSFAGNGTAGFGGDGSAAVSANLNLPTGVATDANGNVFIADQYNNRVRKVNTSGIISTYAGNGAGSFGGDGGMATAAQMYHPTGVSMDFAGNLYIADYNNQRIRKVIASGIINTYVGTGTAGYSGDGGAAVSAKMNNPWGVNADVLGNVFIGDASNSRIRKVNASSGIITTVGGSGTAGFSGDLCAASQGKVNNPAGVSVDGNGAVYFADESNNRIRKIYDNHAPYFVGGHSQYTTMCQNSVDTLNLLLTIADIDPNQGETWSVGSAALHGTVTAVYSGTSTGGTVAPVGLYYTSTIGYIGNDSFKIVITDCSGSADTTLIHVAVSPPPSPITGSDTVCAGLNTLFVDLVGSGLWSSSNTTIATVGASTGMVWGVSAGTATITFAPGASCFVTKGITVNASPAAIVGPSIICDGMATLFSDATAGGVWSSSNPSVFTADSSIGSVTGISLGLATLTYFQAGCPSIKSLSVNPTPPAILAPLPTNICVNTNLTLVEASPGAWSSSTPAVGSINAGGVLFGIAAGTTVITFTNVGGCFALLPVTVNPLPAPIIGPSLLCVGYTNTMTDATSGGVWSASSIGFTATADSILGTVTGVAPGTASISYCVLTTGCSVSTTVTVNNAPVPITGTFRVCAGQTTNLYNIGGGGLWSSSNTSVATIGSSTGLVNGLTTGVTTISYTAPSGCAATQQITVNANPGAITGTLTVCYGRTTTLTTGSAGTWSSGSPTVATVGSTTGLVTGVTPGNTVITFSNTLGCTVTAVVTVNSSPGPITGTLSACPTGTTLLSNAVGGGSWSSSIPSVAGISIGGLVTGSTPGTTTITYSLGAGCLSTATYTVNNLPAVITGPLTACQSSTATLSDLTPGGTWMSSAPSIATIGSATGLITGNSPGLTVISYVVSGAGCYRTANFTVNALPAVIIGGPTVCQGLPVTLTDATTGGLWTSTTTSVATIGSTSGIVNGVTAGVTNIIYTLNTGCQRSKTITVNPLPALFTVTGGGAYCVGGAGLHIGLSGSVTGISYQLYVGGMPTGLTVTGTGGVLDFGLQTAAGTYTIQATTAAGCAASMTGSVVISINPLPAPISGASAVCVGSSATLSSSPAGGTWSSVTTTTGTIGAVSGVFGGIAIGTTIITYSLPTGCYTTRTETVSTAPTAIVGASVVCNGASITLTDGVTGGLWFASGAASVGSTTGVVTGTAVGTAIVTYSLGTGCTVTKSITVNASPAAISGGTSLCAGATLSLSDVTPGGAWSSSAPFFGSISTTGLVAGVAPGSTTISYTVGGCSALLPITVNAIPTAISGPTQVCIGSSVTVTDAVAGGLWSTTSTSFSIGSSTGNVTGIAAGTGVITYAIGSCQTVRSISVNGAPVISGATGLCVGTTTTLSAPGGGTWTSGTIGVATIGLTSGIVTGLTTGTSMITFTGTAGCSATRLVTVNTAPGSITGILRTCVGQTTTLSNTVGGGTWTSSNTSIATAGSLTGIVTGIAPGISTITYSLGTGCTVSAVVTVGTTPAAITGASQVCVGSTITLSDLTTGGSWSSSSTTIAGVGAGTGVVSGGTPGVVTISYTIGSGCAATKSVTVTTGPSAISGTAVICADGTTLLSDAVIGGIWISSAPLVATVGSLTGLVTGMMAGTSTITYTMGAGCQVTKVVTVNASPTAITGTAVLCIGTSTVLSDASPGGTWTSGSTGIATVGATTGLVTGSSAGTAMITYSTGTGCNATREVTVNAPPAGITGSNTLCMGSMVIESNATPGGTWSSSNLIIATVGSASGIVTGVNTGFAVISYTTAGGCVVTKIVTVNLPPPGISGASRVCVGSSTTLTDPASGGVWRSSNTGIASVGSLSGVVSGVSGGVVTISYQVSEGCVATYPVTVNSVPAFTGLRSLCAWGDTVTIHDADGTGIYSSTLVTVANLGSGNARVTSSVPGTGTITYTLPTGCTTSAPATVNPLPGAITGSYSICVGSTATLTSSPGGGNWSSGATTIATVGSISGLTSGIAAGTARITYTLPTGCKTDTAVRVNPIPAGITGWGSVITVGTSSTYADATPGGIWTSSNPAIATIGMTTGTVYGVSPGVVTISYTVGTSCAATRVLTVRVLPGTGR